ncbi:MAG: adenylyltransferase/cytidyltransferase family protein [Lachnospira sp.]
MNGLNIKDDVMNSNLIDELKKGLYCWYPFKKDAVSIFAMEGNMPDFCMLKDDSVDYFVGSYVIETAKDPVAVLSEIRRVLKPDGHALIGCENRLGLRYFCGDREPFSGRCFDGVEGYKNFLESDSNLLDGRLYAAYEIEEMLNMAGLGNNRRLSILPGLEMPQQMYERNYLPEEEIDIRFSGLYHNPDTLLLNEAVMYDGIVKNGMFHQMANAYLYDCTKDGFFYEINHVTTSIDRGFEKATATIIEKNGTVIKKALYSEGEVMLDRLYDNIKAINERGISVVTLNKEQDDNGNALVRMPYMKCDTALTYLRELFFSNRDMFIEKTRHFLQLIMKSSKPAKEQPVGNELGPIYEKAYTDMVPLNCFYDGSDFIFYDQEYVEENYPIGVVVVRALDIIYAGDKTMLAALPEEVFLKEIDEAFVKKLNALRNMGNRYIRDLRNKGSLADMYSKHGSNLTVINTNRQRSSYSMQEYQDIFVNLIKPGETRDIYVFGAGQWARKFVAEFGDKCHIKAMIDNNPDNHGKYIDGVEVTGINVLKDLERDSFRVIVCVKYYATILLQLRKLGIDSYGIFDPYAEYPMTSQICNDLTHNNLTGSVDNALGEIAKQPKKYKVGYIAGVFDLFHVGHLNMFKRAKEQCEYLLVGVVSDEQATGGKNKSPYINEADRLEIVKSNKYVDDAFILPVMASGTKDVFKKYHFDVQFSGSDYEHDEYWLGEQEWLRKHGADMVFFPYTQSTSSTKIKESLNSK